MDKINLATIIQRRYVIYDFSFSNNKHFCVTWLMIFLVPPVFFIFGVFCFCHHFFCILEFSVFNFFEYYGLKSWGDAKKSLNRTNKYFCLFTFIVVQFLQYYLRKDHVKTWLRQKQFPNSPSFLGVFCQRQGMYFFEMKNNV